MTKKKRGRPATDYNEKEINAIIYHYRKEMRTTGDIKYLKLYHYHLDLHKTQPEICSRTYSEDFWRKKGQPGREAIDTANKIRTKPLLEDNAKKDIPNVTYLVDKYVADKEKLIRHLQPLENEMKRSSQKENKLQEEIEQLKDLLTKEREEKKKLKEQVKKLTECIFRFFYYSDEDGTPLENVLDINNKNKRIKLALEEGFNNDSKDLYFQMENYRSKEGSEASEEKKVVSLADEKKGRGKTVADKFKGRF